MALIRSIRSNEVHVGTRMSRRMKTCSLLEHGAVIKICDEEQGIVRGIFRVDGSMKDEVFTINDNSFNGRYCMERVL